MDDRDFVMCLVCKNKIFKGDKVFWMNKHNSRISIPTCGEICAEKFKETTINELKEKIKMIEAQEIKEDIY